MLDDKALLQSPVPGVELKFVHVNGVRLRVASAGPSTGDLVLFVHGWPECWFSWRHQMLAVAKQGFLAVAPDLRGFGASDAPLRREAYDCATVCADMVALLRQEFDRESCLLVGHDWGAVLAWHLCLLEPTRFLSVCSMSVPPSHQAKASPFTGFRKLFGTGDTGTFYYIMYHNETVNEDGSAANSFGDSATTDNGLAEIEYDNDVEGLLRRLYFLGNQSSVASLPHAEASVKTNKRGDGNRAGFIPRMPDVLACPEWLPKPEFDYFVQQYRHSGFRGGVNLYRNLERNYMLMQPFRNTKISQPALFIAGTDDMVVIGSGGVDKCRGIVHRMTSDCQCIFLPDTGHWCQQEKSSEVNTELLKFLRKTRHLLGSKGSSRL